jgi:phage gp36-like protein
MDIITTDDVMNSIGNSALKAKVTADEDLQDFIDSRELWVEEQLAGTLTFPLDSVPETLKIALTDIVVWDVYRKKAQKDVPDSVKEAYKQALKDLKSIKENTTVVDSEQQTTVTTQFTVKDQYFNTSMD